MSLHFLFYLFLVILFIILLLIVVVLYYSFSKFSHLLHLQHWEKVIDQKIASVIIYGSEEAPEDLAFESLVNQPFFKSVFLEKLVESERKFSGVAQQDLKKLYHHYHLEEESLKKLTQKKPYLIVGGIQELTSMQVEKTLPQINSFLNHPKLAVYQEAQYAAVHFKGFEGLDFLNTHQALISDWQQLRLLLSVKEIPDESTDNIKNWLESTNDSVVHLTLRLLRKFQFLSGYPFVRNLLNPPSVKIRKEAVFTLQSLENSSTNTELIQSYDEQPEEVQVEIMRMILNSKDARCIDFLKKELQKHPNPQLKINAALALLSLGKEEELRQWAADPGTDADLILIINHAIEQK